MKKYSGSLPKGKEFLLIEETVIGSGTISNSIGIDSESVLVSLFSTSVTDTLTINIYTQTDTGQEKLILTLPVLTASTPELIVERAGPAMDRIRVEAVYTGDCQFSIRVRGAEAAVDNAEVEVDLSPLLIFSPIIQNIPFILANTEYSIVIPVGTKEFSLQTRTDSILKLSFIPGDTLLNYFTIGYGVCYNINNLDGSGLTLYLSSSKPDIIVEVLSWE